MLLKQYAKAGGAVLLTRIIQGGAGFVSIWLLTRILGVGETGVYILAASIISVPTFLLTSLVERPAFLRLARLENEEKARQSEKGITGAAVLGSVVIGAIIAATIWIATPWIARSFDMDKLADWLRLLCTLPIVVAGWTTLASCQQARQRVALSSLGGGGLQAISQTIFLAAVYALDAHSSAVAFAVIASALAPFGFLLLCAPIALANPILLFSGREVSYGAQLSLLRLLTHTEKSLDIWLVGFFGSSESVAIYTVGARLARLLGTGKMAVDSLLVPRIGRHLADGSKNRAAAEHEARMARFFGFSTCLAGLMFLAPLSPAISSLLGDYEAAPPIMLLLAVALMIETGTGTAGQIITMHGLAKPILSSTLVSALIFLAVGASLGSTIGPNGVAFGVLAGAAVRNSAALYFSHSLVGVAILSLRDGLTVAVSALAVIAASFVSTSWSLWAASGIALAALSITFVDVTIRHRSTQGK